jgi:cytochrome c biogenesis protein CcmG/thiol:disulfide interchange protein DsbE
MLAGIILGIALTTELLASPAGQTAATTAPEARKTAPDFTLRDSKGASITLSRYKGRVVLLDFWATWCTGCKVEIPWYMEFQSKYKHGGLSVIGVSMDEDGWKSVKPFLKEHPISYSVVIGNSDLAKLYGVDSMPMTLLIDRNGEVAASHVGMVDKGAFEGEIQMLLKEEAAKRTALPNPKP